MSNATIELDFLGVRKEASSSKSKFRRRFRGMQSTISRMDPEVVKSLMNGNTYTAAAPDQGQGVSRATSIQTSPLTIFYKGRVVVFDLPRDKAENILKLADQVSSKGRDPLGNTKAGVPSRPGDQHQLLDTMNGDLPIDRKRSLQRFLEKREERLTMIIRRKAMGLGFQIGRNYGQIM